MTSPLVYIILLNWNGWRDTVDCVRSCQQLLYPNCRIVVVDNGSTDGSLAHLQQELPSVEILPTGENLGFAEGNNVGIRHALAQGADFIWLLNNDTTVEPGALGPLVLAADGRDRVGMVGSKILYYDDPRTIWYAGTSVSPGKPYLLRHRGLLEQDQGQYDQQGETDFVTGCSLLVRKELIAEVGAFDPSFFLYFEDTDWCARARSHGWLMVYSPDSVVYHKVSKSTGGEVSSLVGYYTARNLLYFVRKNYPGKIASALAFVLFHHFVVPLKKGRIVAAKGGFRGIVDYLRGRSGRL